MNSFFALACLATLAFASAFVDYCKLNCQETGAPNAGCNKTDGLGPSCPEGTEAYDFTEIISSRKLILNSHNAKRNIIANSNPKATRMLTMQWDDELALLAYYTVKQCVELDDCRRTNRYNNPGQNLIFITMNSESKVDDMIEEAITDWYNSSRFLTNPVADIESFPEKKLYQYEHSAAPFARLIIDHNVAVGCAASEFIIVEKEWLFVCNYAYDTEAGKAVFATGPVVASGCTKTNVHFENLCYKADSDNYIKTLPA